MNRQHLRPQSLPSLSHRQQGYTLIELMISITLGLLITAAATQLLVTGSLTLSNQQASANVQDNSAFGMELMARQLRQTNAGNQSLISDGGTLNGIVFSPSDIAATAPVNVPVTGKAANNASSVDGKSDQLVIQYQVLQNGLRDCEGNTIAASDVVIERYFLRQDLLSSETPKPYALACAAFRLATLAGANTAQGSIIMSRVDDFSVVLGTSDTAATWRYYDLQAYKNLAGAKPNIRTVRLAALVRSSNIDPSTKGIKKAATYAFLNETVAVPNPNDGYARRVFMSTVSFRNSLGG